MRLVFVRGVVGVMPSVVLVMLEAVSIFDGRLLMVV